MIIALVFAIGLVVGFVIGVVAATQDPFDPA